MRHYQKLEVWKDSMQLVAMIYETTRNFPREEVFGITGQIKRAAVSIPSNIAEGLGRHYKKDTIHFLHIARGSLYELETLMQTSLMVHYISQEKYDSLVPIFDNVNKLLNGLINYFNKSIP